MKSHEQRVEIVGPEGVPLSFPAALIAERAFAFVVDIAIIGLITTIFVICSVFLAGMTSMAEPLAIMLVGLFVLAYGYFTFFEIVWQGSTPGKRLMNLKVISRDGGGLSGEAVIARNLMREVELFVPLIALTHPEAVFGRAPLWLTIPTAAWVLVMLLLPLIGKERTRVGDLVGGTLVVRVPRAELRADEAARAPVSQGLKFTREQLSHYGEAELEALADIIRRVEALTLSADDMSVIAQTIAQKIRYLGPETQSDPGRFLQVFYRQQRAELERRLLFGKRKASKHDA